MAVSTRGGGWVWPRDTNFPESRWESKSSDVVMGSWEHAGMASWPRTQGAGPESPPLQTRGMRPVPGLRGRGSVLWARRRHTCDESGTGFWGAWWEWPWLSMEGLLGQWGNSPGIQLALTDSEGSLSYAPHPCHLSALPNTTETEDKFRPRDTPQGSTPSLSPCPVTSNKVCG